MWAIGEEMEMNGTRGATLPSASEYLQFLYPNHGITRPLIRDPEVNPNSRVLVVAAHHDDPIYGCGGTMCKLAKLGAHVKVLYMTDYSYESNIGPSSRLVPLVRTEAEESLAKLRCYESEHLELPCLRLRCDDVSRRLMLRAIEDYSPEIVFIPSLQDVHTDNRMTGSLAAHALKGYSGCLTLYSYEVWGGLFPNTMVDITDVMDDKIAAINVRRSQARPVDGEQRVREANAYRLSTMLKERYGEPFLRQERKDFVAWANRLGAYQLTA